MQAQLENIERYKDVSIKKLNGATYTPKILSDFVAERIIEATGKKKKVLRILDPAVGDGELLFSLLERLPTDKHQVEVYGFDTNIQAIDSTTQRLSRFFPTVSLHLSQGNFLDFVEQNYDLNGIRDLFQQTLSEEPKYFDLIIANPPYVRTQIMGGHLAQNLARRFGLSGRVDLYYAFVLGISCVLKQDGIAGIIVSNRFMSTKSGASVRKAILKNFTLKHVWDLGDTKLFDAAVLPAVLLVKGKGKTETSGVPLEEIKFTSIYEADLNAENEVRGEQPTVLDPITALSEQGLVKTKDERTFLVKHGQLDTGKGNNSNWRISTSENDDWLNTVSANTYAVFRDIGKVRVGVKTCADKIFIRSDWKVISKNTIPELLFPLTTHHIARQFKPSKKDDQRYILYPHESLNGNRQVVELSKYPHSKKYLESHKQKLEARSYVLQAGRKWYEIWVPQDPGLWEQPKLVFRDISEKPTFWIDLDHSIVNGDCYWITCDDTSQNDLLWLAAAVANSTFIEDFYDRCFNNKLYAGRRRFITQYVEQFPLPNPARQQALINKAKEIYHQIESNNVEMLCKELDQMVWSAFGLSFKKV